MVHVPRYRCATRVLALAMLLPFAPPAGAGDRLEWTGGVSEIEGAAGGGLVPWALIAGLGTADQVGGSAFATGAETRDFRLRAAGVAVGALNRVELSWARERFDIGSVVPGVTLGQDVVGLKVRLLGDAIVDQDRWWPQLAAGALVKRTSDFGGVPQALGAGSGTGTDLYLAATKVYLGGAFGHNLLLDVTLRRSDANQYGLVGFGGGRPAVWRPEGSLAVWLADPLLFGVEYRAKRAGLASPDERNAGDAFLAWEPDRHVAVVLAWADLGPVAFRPTERGAYLSVTLMR